MKEEKYFDENDSASSSSSDFSDTVEIISAKPAAKPSRTRRSTKGTRKVQHMWQDEEINRLIVAVEKHPSLWDSGSPEYKLPKLNTWQEVTDELEMGIDVCEAKSKWACLRVTFKTNLAKKKSGDMANISWNVSWKWFTQMKFLEANDVRQATMSTSTINLVFNLYFYFIAMRKCHFFYKW